MANISMPVGLSLVGHRHGAPISGSIRHYYKAAGYGTALFIGDPVVISGTSNTAAVGNAGEFPIAFLPEITVANVAGPATGVMVGKYNTISNMSTKHSAASTEDIILVGDDPNLIWRVEEDNVGGDLAATAVGANADLVATAAGSATTGMSGMELDSSSATTTAGLCVKILGISTMSSENALGTSCKWDVQLNDSTVMPGVAGI